MAASLNPRALRAAYLILYTAGACLTLCCVGLLAWVAICIALEKEPLASISFLPDMPAALVLVLILAIMAVSVACWQYGAKFHQRYEAYMRNQR